MPKTNKDYASFLLRLWRAQEHGRPIWRASLESTQTGQRQNFTDLECLIAFLKSQFEACGQDNEDENFEG